MCVYVLLLLLLRVQIASQLEFIEKLTRNWPGERENWWNAAAGAGGAAGAGDSHRRWSRRSRQLIETHFLPLWANWIRWIELRCIISKWVAAARPNLEESSHIGNHSASAAFIFRFYGTRPPPPPPSSPPSSPTPPFPPPPPPPPPPASPLLSPHHH